MDYCDMLVKAIYNSDLNKNTCTILSNMIVSAYNRVDDDDNNGLPNIKDIKKEHQIGKRIINELQLYNDGKNMDNVTIPETKLILDAVKSLNPDNFYLSTNFNNSKNDAFAEIFYDYADDLATNLNDARNNSFKKYINVPELIILASQRLIYVTNSDKKIDKEFKKTPDLAIYYKYVRKYLKKFNDIFTQYLQRLGLLNKEGHIKLDKIKRLNNKQLIYNYCNTHCISAIPPSNFTKIITNMFQSFKTYRKVSKTYDITHAIGISFGLYTLCHNANLINDFHLNGEIYSVVYDYLTVLIILLNLFADYVQHRAFKPNKIAGQTINQITMCQNYDNKTWRIITKMYYRDDDKD